MRVHALAEPMLRFGAKGTHVDVRAGLAKYGAFDISESNAPNPIRLGLIGTTATIDGVRDWLEACSGGVESNEDKYRELRPDFPGMSVFGTQLSVSDAATRAVSRHELRSALSQTEPVYSASQLFIDHARDLAGKGNLQVLVVAPPPEVFALGDGGAPSAEADLDDAQEAETKYQRLNFHDSFKAMGLEVSVPSQIVRPDTYGGDTTRRGNNTRTLQDHATRAWNFHTALYYKAGGVPWRLGHGPSGLSTCYVGTSFFKSLDGGRLATSVAQVFNERGEGLILQGGNARIDRDDRTPHLAEGDAYQLLSNGLATYRREHKTMPARVLVHKTSYFDQAEIDGCRRAADEQRVELLDLVSVRRAGIRLLREGVPAVRRGTALVFDDTSGLVYLKGTVPFFRTYPGMYIPRALEFARDDGESSPVELAKELLELSKLNFNNTQFDGGDPVTVRAARRVGDILKHVSPDRAVQSRFRFFT